MADVEPAEMGFHGGCIRQEDRMASSIGSTPRKGGVGMHDGSLRVPVSPTVALMVVGLLGILAGCRPAALDPCTLLTTAELHDQLNVVFEAGSVVGVPGDPASSCFWSTVNGDGPGVVLSARGWDEGNWEWLRGHTSAVTELGDEALFNIPDPSHPAYAQISIKKAMRVVSISINGLTGSESEGRRLLTELGKRAVSRLPP